jgi:hypothetical protein
MNFLLIKNILLHISIFLLSIIFYDYNINYKIKEYFFKIKKNLFNAQIS